MNRLDESFDQFWTCLNIAQDLQNVCKSRQKLSLSDSIREIPIIFINIEHRDGNICSDKNQKTMPKCFAEMLLKFGGPICAKVHKYFLNFTDLEY